MSKKTRGVGPHSRRIAWSRSHTSPYQRRGVQCPICLWSGNKEADFKMHWKERHEASPDAIMQAHSTMLNIHQLPKLRFKRKQEEGGE